MAFPYGAEWMMKTYFNSQARPSSFTLALIGYSSQGTWISPCDVSEISGGSYSRLTIQPSLTAPPWSTGTPTYTGGMATIEMVQPITFAVPQFILNGVLNSVNGSTSIIGWAIIANGNPTQPFLNTQNIICAGKLDTPITPTTMSTEITINPLRIWSGNKAAAGSWYVYPEAIPTDWFNYEILRMFFGLGSITSPSLEVALVSAVYDGFYGGSDNGWTEVSTAFDATQEAYARQNIAALSGVISTVGNGTQIAFPSVHFHCGQITSQIAGYVIVRKESPSANLMLEPQYVLCYGDLPSIIPANTKGLRIDVTPIMAYGFGTPN
jgi:hypothetical protein